MDQTLLRISELMQEKKIQDQQMIEYLGLPKGTFSNWRRDKGKSFYEHIAAIADRLDVSIDYLIRGKDVKINDLTHQEVELVENFRKLSADGRRIVSENTKMLAEK